MSQFVFYAAAADTRNFTLEGFGTSPKEALKALAAMWSDWISKTGATLTVKEILEDSWVREITTGHAYMDKENYFARGSESDFIRRGNIDTVIKEVVLGLHEGVETSE